MFARAHTHTHKQMQSERKLVGQESLEGLKEKGGIHRAGLRLLSYVTPRALLLASTDMSLWTLRSLRTMVRQSCQFPDGHSTLGSTMLRKGTTLQGHHFPLDPC